MNRRGRQVFWRMSHKLRHMFAEADVTLPDTSLQTAIEQGLLAEQPPIPTALQTQALCKRLGQVLEQTEPALGFREQILAQRRSLRQPKGWVLHMANQLLLVVKPQVHLFGWAYWLSTALVMSLGFLFLPGENRPVLVPLFLVAPLLAVLGVALAFRSYSYGVAEWERGCPISPTQLLLARIFLVVFYDIVLGTVVSCSLYQRGIGDSLALLILAWLAPLLTLAGITLLATIRWGTLTATNVGLVLWLIFAFGSRGGGNLLYLGPLAPFTLTLLGLIGIGCLLLGVYRGGKWGQPYAD